MTIASGLNIFPQGANISGGGGGGSKLINFKGNYDASTNTPALVNGTGNVGDWYYVSVGGTNNPTGVNIPAGHAIYYSSSNTWLDYGIAPTIVGATLPIQNIGNTISLLYDNITLDAAGTGSALEIKASGVNTTQLANKAVTSAKIADNTIVNSNLALGIINDNNLSDTSTVICQYENDFNYPVGVACYYQNYIWYSAQFPNLNNTPAQGSAFWYRARDTGVVNDNTHTSNYTLQYNDNVILMDCTSGNLVLTVALITALQSSPNTVKNYTVYKMDNTNNTLSIALTAPNTWQGGATTALTLKGQGAASYLAVIYGSSFILQS